MASTAYILESDFSNFNAEVGNFTGTPPLLIFQYGAALFVCIKRFTTSTNCVIAIYRTTDGQNFTSYLGPDSGNIDVMFAKEGNKVYALFLTHGSDNAVKLSVFNLDTLTYAATVTGGPTATPASMSMGFQVYGGVITFFYYRTIAFVPNLFYAIYNSGWSAETFVETMASNGFRGMGLDPDTGNMAIAYIPLAPFPTRFRSFSGGVLSAAADNATQLSVDYGNCPMLYIPEEDKWAMPSATAGGGMVSLFTATPSVNPVTVAIESVAVPAAADVYKQPAVRREGSNITVFFEQYLSSGGSVTTQLILAAQRAVSSAAWGSPSTLFDRTTDTFSPVPSTATRDNSRSFLPLSSDVFSFAAQNPGTTLNQYLVGVPAESTTIAETPGPSGRKPIPQPPNQYDYCLHREFRLFQQIDYELLGCGRLPSCFKVDEREWGGWE